MVRVLQFGLFRSVLWAVSFYGLLVTSVLAERYESQQRSGYFEGKLDYVLSYYSQKNGKALGRDFFSLLMNKDRILFPAFLGELEVGSLIPPDVDSALFRNDKNDIVLYGEGYDAYQVKGFDMTLLGMVFKGLALTDTPTNLPAPTFGGKFELRGKRTELWRYVSQDGYRIDMYFCGDYRIRWGILSKSWLFGGGGLKIARLDEFLSHGQLPVRVDVFKNGKRFNSLNLMSVREGEVPAEQVSVPHPKILNSATKLLWEMTRR